MATITIPSTPRARTLNVKIIVRGRIRFTESLNNIIIGYKGLKNLIKKGPSYREQNNIDWKVNEKTSKEADSRYYQKWAKAACVDKRVFRDWKEAFIAVLTRELKYYSNCTLISERNRFSKARFI